MLMKDYQVSILLSKKGVIMVHSLFPYVFLIKRKHICAYVYKLKIFSNRFPPQIVNDIYF